ncbi:Bacterial Ig-like domain protein [Cryptosporidium felis]|nr:Bacterial Ig-like domain protein [Cryptosporidium felis]
MSRLLKVLKSGFRLFPLLGFAVLDLVASELGGPEIGILSEIRGCASSLDCGGRPCFQRLCTGFAGNRERTYRCLEGEECILDSLPGHFNPAIQRTYGIAIVSYDSECSGKDHLSFECSVASENTCVLLFSQATLKLGRYKLCGTVLSKEDPQAQNFPEFPIPIGFLDVIGFSRPLSTNGRTSNEGQKSEQILNKEIFIRNESLKICTANVPCTISGIQGFGISENFKVIEIHNSTNSCGLDLGSDETIYPHKCTPYNDRTECYFSTISQSTQITTLCGCVSTKENPCSSPSDYKFFLGNVLYHRGIQSGPSRENLKNHTIVHNETEIMQKEFRRLQKIDPCASCVNGYGLCYGNPKTCYGGFGNNPYEPPVILCVDGYDCKVKGKILGEQITSRYKIAASPMMGCGVRILGKDESMFSSQSQWNCEGGNPFDCEVHFGVGRRYNRSEVASNTMLLCGCPDFASVGMPCDEPAEFYFPVAQIRVVECTDNTHCMHNALASCNLETNQCQGVLPSVAQIGLGTMQCLSRQSCNIANIGQFIGGEMYRVIQTAPYVKCGANVALDPDYYQKVQTQMESTGPGGMGLPCIVQSEEGSGAGDPGSPKTHNCAINLGTNAILGVNRLCGCSGVDRDGNGIPCDSAEDFDTDLGLLDVGECNSDKDCKPGQVCTEHKCVNDQLLPYPVGFSPLNHSILIPPVKQLVIRFNENIEYPKNWEPRRLVISSNLYYRTKPLEIPITPAQKESRLGNHQQQLTALNTEEKTRNSESSRWTWWNKAKNQNSNQGSNSSAGPVGAAAPVLYSADIRGQKVVVNFDSRTPLPEDSYIVGLEAGAVSDLHGNPNDGIPLWTFTISRNASCPFMYITGFSTNNGNVNGLYTPWKAPKNGKAVWNGGERKQFFVYYSILDSEFNNGTWVIDRDLDSSDILAFAESVLPDPNNHVPPDGKTTIWKKWLSINPEEEPEWIVHEDISVICRSFPEKSAPSLIAIQPSLGSVGVSPNNTEIRLTFNRAMNYGHWAWFNITGRTTGHLIHIPTDFEAKQRGLTVISDQTPDVIIRSMEPLVEGEVYDITAELGALTDLTYQPWGNVGPNQLFFTTSGDSCRELNLLSFYDKSDLARYKVEYSHSPKNDQNSDLLLFPPGTNAKLKCSSGFSARKIIMGTPKVEGEEYSQEMEDKNVLEGSFGCVRGGWQESKRIKCFQKCKPYPITSSSSQNYLIQESLAEGDEEESKRKEGEDYINGSRLLVRCAGTEGSEEITCNDGTWSPLTLVCGTSCPPYSLPNESYLFKYEEDRMKHSPESEITISCTDDSDKVIHHKGGTTEVAENSKDFRITCIEGRWESGSQIYKCFKRCSSLSESALSPEQSLSIYYDKEAISGYLKHGSMARITCSKNWSPVGKEKEVIFGCVDGSWFFLNKELAPTESPFSGILSTEFKCEKKCNELEIFSNKAYKIESLTEERILPGSKVRISCEKDFGSAQFGTRSTDTIECLNGVWSIPKTICMKHCESPEETLGKAYSISNNLGSTKRKGLYTHGTRVMISCSDQGTLIQGGELHQTATCTNGEWVFDNVLICASKCSTLKLPARYQIRNLSSLDISADTGDTRIIGCTRPGDSDIEEVIICRNGEWKPSIPSIDCFSSCSVEDLEPLRELFEILGLEKERRTIDHGESLRIMCKKGYVRRTGPLKDFLKCQNGVFQTPMLICEKPNCFDGIQNQGEYGVDCGGVCEKKCPDTCFDGILNGDEESIDCGGSCGVKNCPKCNDKIKNGDETGVDCGGSQCPTCEPCHGFPITNLPENIILSVDGGFNYIGDLQKESFLIENMAIASGSELHIRCIPGWEQEESLESKLQILTCEDGNWSLSPSREKIALKCAPPSCEDGIRNGDEWGVDCGGSCENQCSSCNDGIRNGDETGVDCGGSVCRSCDPCDSDLIHKLEGSDRYILSGDSLSGEIPLHGSKLMLTCPSSENSVTITCNDGEWVNREAVRYLPCTRNGFLKSAQAPGSIEDDYLEISLENLRLCRESSGSCCKLVQRFSEVWGGECGTMYRQGRDTSIKTFCKGKCMSLLKSSLEEFKKATEENFSNETFPESGSLSVECGAAVSISNIIDSHLCQVSENKNECSFSFHETLMIISQPVSLVSQQRTLEQLCQRENCHRRNLRLIQALSHLSKTARKSQDDTLEMERSGMSFIRREDIQFNIGKPSGLNGGNEDFWKEIVLSRSEKSLNLLCLTTRGVSNPKEKHPCIGIVSEMVSSDKNPVNWLLGIIHDKGEKKEGRRNQSLSDRCVRNLPEDSCLFLGARVFGQLLMEVGTETNNEEMSQTGLLLRSFGRYFCQEAKNNRFCGHFLFSGIRNGPNWWESFKSLSFGNISPTDICSPYNLSFSCSPHCKKKLLDQLNNKGCCFAPQLEIQRGILEMEVEISKVNKNRSVDYLEQRCGFSMDRVCSSGVKTDLILLEFIFKNLNFFEISNSVQEDILRTNIRETVSSFLSIPVSDIPRIRAWPGSYVVEVLIDAGLSSRTVLNTLEESQNQLINELNKIDTLDQDFGIKISRSTISHSRSLSTSISPPPPYVGTFDMDSLSNQLDFPNCPKPSLGTLGIEDLEEGYEINGDNSLRQGAFRNVACSHFFSPVSPSPASQSFICDNGRWRTTQHEAKILCKKACRPFSPISYSLPELNQGFTERQSYGGQSFEITSSIPSSKQLYTSIGYNGEAYTPSFYSRQDQLSSLPSQKQFIISGIGEEHGATRSVSCSPGYVSDNPDLDSQSFKCSNGNWESDSDGTFNCVRGAEASLKYCRSSFLSNVLGTEKYYVEELFDLSNKPDEWKMFKITCSRGYEAKIEPILLACSNGNFFNIPGDTVTISKSDSSDFIHSLILKTVFGGTSREEGIHGYKISPRVPPVSFTQNDSNFRSRLNPEVTEDSENNIFSIITCDPKRLTKLSESKGLSGPALYAILFVPLIFGMLVLAILFWFRKYKWKRNLQYDKNSQRETLAILDIKRRNALFDLETASPFSEPGKPTSEEGESIPSKFRSPKGSTSQKAPSNTLLAQTGHSNQERLNIELTQKREEKPPKRRSEKLRENRMKSEKVFIS